MSFRSGVLNNKMLKIYIDKYIDGELDVDGIKLIPSLNETKNIIEWSLKNPKKLSYSYWSLKNFIIDSLFEYYKLLGINPDQPTYISKGEIMNYIQADFGDYYNPEDIIKLNSIMSKADSVLTCCDEDIESECEVTILDLKTNFEELKIYLRIDILNFKNQEEIITDTNEMVRLLEKCYDVIMLDECVDYLLEPIADVVWQNNRINYNYEMSTNVIYNFYYKNKYVF